MRGVCKGDNLKVIAGNRWIERPGRFSYQEVVGWSLTMALKGGCLLWRTEDQDETVEWLRGLDNWFTSKEWEDHKAHLDWYSPEPEGNPFEGPSLVQRVAAVLPGLGSTRSRNVAKHFSSVRAMLTADEKEWAKVEGVGSKTAKKIVEALK
jgi:ERCC4-type nuclease